MLLPAILKSILLYGGLAIAGFGVLLFTVVRDEKQKREAENLPEAKLVAGGGTSAIKHRIHRWLPAVLLFGGIGLAVMMWKATTDVIVVTDDGGSVSASRKVRLFGSSDYQLAPGREPYDHGHPTWVVNHSSRSVRVKTVRYGRSLAFGGDRPAVIPPSTAASFRRIDHIGPSDPPPQTVPDEINLGMEWREWLIWD